MTCDMIMLDYQNRDPIYLQIVNQIERYIALGILKEGAALPSIRDLASYLGINPNTVKKAYTELEGKNLIVSISTKGCFVSKQIEQAKNDKINQELMTIKHSIAELKQLGLKEKEIQDKMLSLLNERMDD